MPSESGLNGASLDLLRSQLNPVIQTEGIEYLYAENAEGHRRWSNLASYLEYMKSTQPDILMVGEAPGYRGTSVSGVPFLSEDMIKRRTANQLAVPVYEYAPSSGYNDESGYEATSKVMWNVLDEVPTLKFPLLWAVFPNHPHIVGNAMTNRKPTKKEIAEYSGVLSTLIAIYPMTHYQQTQTIRLSSYGTRHVAGLRSLKMDSTSF